MLLTRGLLVTLLLALGGTAAFPQTGCSSTPNLNFPYVGEWSLTPAGINAGLQAAAPSPAVYNTVSGGVVDASTAIQNGLNSSQGFFVLPAATYRIASPITVPDGMSFICQSSQPTYPTNPGCVLVCDLSVTPCITIGNNDNQPNVMKGITVSRAAGTIPPGSKCILVNGGDDVTLEDVMCNRHAQGFVLQNNGATGIYFHGNRLYTCATRDAHVVVSGWPGAYFIQSVLGCNGSGDVASNAFIRITGDWDATAGTVHFNDVHMNQGNSTAVCGVIFQNFTGSTNVLTDFEILGGHLETAQNAFCTDRTVKGLTTVQVIGLWTGGGWGGGNHYFADASNSYQAGINAATTINAWTFEGDTVNGYSDVTLAPRAQFNDLKIEGSSLLVPVSITGASNSTLNLVGNAYDGVAIAGSFGIARVNGIMTGGMMTNNATRGIVEIDIPGAGQNSVTNCSAGFGLQIGGSRNGITYTQSPVCRWQVVGNMVHVSINASITGIASLTGIATLTGLPYKAAASNISVNAMYGTGWTSVSGGILASPGAGSKTINLYTQKSTGVSAMTNSNLSGISSRSPAVIAGTITYLMDGIP
jgi:hypothetical protein